MTIIERTPEGEPLIIAYVNILHKYGIGSSETLSFRNQYNEGKTFQRRAGVLELLIENKDTIKII